MNFYDYKTVSYARPQKALPTNEPIDFYDYKTVSYARPQAAVPTNNPMVSDTAKEVLNPVGTTSGSSIWGDLGRIGDIISGGGIINGSFVDRIFGRGTTSSSNSIWGDLGSIAGKTFGELSGRMSGKISDPLSDDPERRKYESALGEAEAILGPQYQRAREQTMSEVDRNMVSRGFYGQAPGDAIRASTLTDLDTAYQAALGNYATNIMDRRTQMDLQKYMFDTDVMDRRAQMDLQKYMFDKGLEEQWKMFDREMEEYKKAQMDLQKYMFDKGLEEQWKMFEKEMQEQRQQSKDRKKSSLNLGIGTIIGGIAGGPVGAAIGTGIGNILSSIFG